MKPLVVLLVTFAVGLFVLRFLHKRYDFALAARAALSVMLLFTAVAHFVYTNGMALMIPGFIPFKKAIVYLTGFLEIFAAIGLHISGLRAVTAWLLILFFLLLLPANINAAIKHVDYQKANVEGNGINYLWFRIPLQLLFITWTYMGAIQA